MKNQNATTTTHRWGSRHVLLRDTGKRLKVKTGLKAGKSAGKAGYDL